MIDTHCHIDLYERPLDVAKASEAKCIPTIAVTYLPSHFELAEQHLRSFHYVRPALGLHPMASKDHQKELPSFRRLVERVSLIGEIGLDFTHKAKASQNIQEDSFSAVLECLRGKRRFITLHSRGAESVVLQNLKAASIRSAVFHWFSGSRSQLIRVLDDGHMVSVNTAMIKTQKWLDYVKLVPKERVLTESDGPFAKCNSRIAVPSDLADVENWLAEQWKISPREAGSQIQQNFKTALPGNEFSFLFDSRK